MVVYIVVGGFILFDIITGVLSALHKGELCSTKLRQGLYHKASEILAVVGSALLEHSVQYIDLDISLPLFKPVATYICLMELVSIIENLCSINDNMTKFLKPYLDKLKPKIESEVKKDGTVQETDDNQTVHGHSNLDSL